MSNPNALEGAIAAVLRFRRLLGVALFLGVLLTVVQVSGLREHLDLASVRQLVLQHQIDGLLLFVLLFSLGNLIHVPGLLFLAAAVLTLGRLWGGAVTYIAAVTSCTITFLVIRAIGGNSLRLLKNQFAMRMLRELDNRPIVAVVFLRIFFQTVPTVNYALAMSGIRFRDYVLGTLAGLPVPIAVYCIFFDLLATGLQIR